MMTRYFSEMRFRMRFFRFSQSEMLHILRTGVCFSVCLGILWSSGGCLRRRMTINSNPPGATVYVDGHQIGKTPVSTDFTYYGTRNIRLEMDNYQTLAVKQKVTPPWYEYPVFDFFSETFTPGEVKDNHVWTYDLQQRAISSDEQILTRANNFAFEGSRMVNSDGSLGTPVTAENYSLRNSETIGQNPDTGFETPLPYNGMNRSTPTEMPPGNSSVPQNSAVPQSNSTIPDSYPAAPNGSAVPPESSEPTWNSMLQQQENAPAGTVPAANPNAFPSGSADWDTPNRYPGTN